MDKIKYALQFFQDAGWDLHQAKGIVANLLQESDLDPSALSKSGKYFGIAQHGGPRRDNLMSYAERNNIDPYTLETQLQFINHELKGDESKAAEMLKTAKDEKEATILFRNHYERPGAKDTQARLDKLSKLEGISEDKINKETHLFDSILQLLSPKQAEAADISKNIIPNPIPNLVPDPYSEDNLTTFTPEVVKPETIEFNKILDMLKPKGIENNTEPQFITPETELYNSVLEQLGAKPESITNYQLPVNPVEEEERVKREALIPKIAVERNYGSIKNPDTSLPLTYDIPLWLATAPISGVVGAVTALAGAPEMSVTTAGAASGLQYQILRETINAFGGPEPSKPISLSGYEEQANPILKPWIRSAGQAMDMAILGPVLQKAGKSLPNLLKALDKVYVQPLREASDQLWKPVSDFIIKNLIITPTPTGQPLGSAAYTLSKLGITINPDDSITKIVDKLLRSGIERLRSVPGQEETVKTLETGRSYRNMLRAFESKVQSTINEFTPTERADYIHTFANSKFKPESQRVKDLVNDTKGFLSNNIELQTAIEFRKELRTLVLQPFKNRQWKALNTALETAEQSYQPTGTLNRLYKEYFTKDPSLLTPRDTRNILDSVIQDATLPEIVRQQAAAIYTLPYQKTIDIARASNIAMRDFITRGVINNPNATALSPGNGFVKSTWRDLKGLNIHEDLETELHGMDKLLKPAEGWYNEWFLPMWKTNKVILRPPAWGRQLIGNILQNDWGGLPFWRMDIYLKGLGHIYRNDPQYKEFTKLTAYADIFATEDVGQFTRFAKHGENMFETSMRIYNSIADPARKYYGLNEQWAKYSKYLHNLERGMDKTEAATDALKWTFNYGETSTFVQTIRQSAFGMPFATWWSKILPQFVETSVRHPLRVAKWYGLYKMWQAHALDEVNMTDEEWATMNKQFPGYLKNGMYALMPWRDDKGQLKLLDMGWLVPSIGDWNQLYQRSTMNPWGVIFQSPIMGAISGLTTKTRPGGAPLYYDWEEPKTAAMKTFSYLWDIYTPGMLGGIDYRKMMDTINERPEALTSEEFLASQMGLPLISINQSSIRRRRNAINDIYTAEVGMDMRSKLRKTNDLKEREQIRSDARKAGRRIWGRNINDNEKSLSDQANEFLENRK